MIIKESYITPSSRVNDPRGALHYHANTHTPHTHTHTDTFTLALFLSLPIQNPQMCTLPSSSPPSPAHVHRHTQTYSRSLSHLKPKGKQDLDFERLVKQIGFEGGFKGRKRVNMSNRGRQVIPEQRCSKGKGFLAK